MKSKNIIILISLFFFSIGYVYAEMWDVDENVSIEIVDNRLSQNDAYEIYDYIISLYNNSRFNKVIAVSNGLKEYYGNELSDNCDLLIIKSQYFTPNYGNGNSSWDPFRSIADSLKDFFARYHTGDVIESGEAAKTAAKIISGIAEKEYLFTAIDLLMSLEEFLDPSDFMELKSLIREQILQTELTTIGSDWKMYFRVWLSRGDYIINSMDYRPYIQSQLVNQNIVVNWKRIPGVTDINNPEMREKVAQYYFINNYLLKIIEYEIRIKFHLANRRNPRISDWPLSIPDSTNLIVSNPRDQKVFSENEFKTGYSTRRGNILVSYIYINPFNIDGKLGQFFPEDTEFIFEWAKPNRPDF